MRRVRILVLLTAACLLAALPSHSPGLARVATANYCDACYSQYLACMDWGYGYGVCCPAYNDCLGDDPEFCGYCPEWQHGAASR